MRFDILTLFPALFASFLSESLMAKGLAKGLLSVNLVDVRNFCFDRHRSADDRPFGGGPGMVLKPEPLALAIESLKDGPGPGPRVIHLTPSGRLLNQAVVRELASRERLALICGRYEGVDQRVLDLYADEEISIGDYVVNGGEVPAMALMEALARLIPGFLGREESSIDDSHGLGLLEGPCYTRPRVWRGRTVPAILLSGHHAQVATYRLAENFAKTKASRPELLDEANLIEAAAEFYRRPGSPLKSRDPRPETTASGAKTTDSSTSDLAETERRDLSRPTGGEPMKSLERDGKTYPVDHEGFLLDPALWDRGWVELIREDEEIDELTEEHWEVIESLRAYQNERGAPPRVRDMTAVTGYKMKHIYELFPSGPGKGACKMAGLSKPDGCV
jgi:tRNA (guanine37-N1)-methyltransferase